MNWWNGLDADSWGNVIAASTGAAAIVGGVVTFSLNAWRDRVAGRKEQKANRDAELHAQARGAVEGVMRAALACLDVLREKRQDRNPTADKLRELEDRRGAAVREIMKGALLVHDKDIRHGLYRGVEAIRLGPFLAHFDEWEPSDLQSRDERLAGSIRDLAAAYLRDDASSVKTARSDIEAAWETGNEARQLQEAEEEEERHRLKEEADRKRAAILGEHAARRAPSA